MNNYWKYHVLKTDCIVYRNPVWTRDCKPLFARLHLLGHFWTYDANTVLPSGQYQGILFLIKWPYSHGLLRWHLMKEIYNVQLLLWLSYVEVWCPKIYFYCCASLPSTNKYFLWIVKWVGLWESGQAACCPRTQWGEPHPTLGESDLSLGKLDLQEETPTA